MNTSIPADSFPAGLVSKIRFVWRCRGGNANGNNGSARLVYSINDGQTWSERSRDYSNNNAWLKDSIEINPTNFPGFVAGTTPIRFGFRWRNQFAFFGVNDPPMLVDNIQVVQEIPALGITLTSVSPASGNAPNFELCQAASSNVGIFVAGQFPPGTTYNVEISDSTGTFPATPRVIGSGSASPIAISLPPNMFSRVAGFNFRLRVRSSNNVLSNNTFNLRIAPSLPVSATITSNPPPPVNVCPGTTVNFSANVVNGGQAPQYQWFANNQELQFANNNFLAYIAVNSGDVIRLRVRSNALCAAPIEVFSNEIQINTSTEAFTVNLASDPPAPVAVCPGETVNFSFTTNAPSGGSLSYQWLSNGQPLAAATGATLAYTAGTSPASISVRVTSTSPCASPPTVISDSIRVNIATQPASVALTLNAAPNTACQGDTLLFTATPINGGSEPSYVWWVNNQPVAGETAGTYRTAGLVDGDRVTVVLTSSSTCASPRIDTAEVIAVALKPKPSVSISPALDTLCSGAEATLRARVANGNGSESFVWLRNGSPISGFSDSVAVFGALEANVSLQAQISSSACLSPVTQLSASIYVRENPVVLAGSDTSLYATDSPFMLTGFSPPGGTWQGEGLENLIFNPNRVGEGPTVLTYTYNTPGGCGGSARKTITLLPSSTEVYNAFSPNDDGSNNVWKVFPDFGRRFPNGIVRVFNRWGSLVFESKKGYPEPWDGKYNGTPVPVGTYYYSIDLGNSTKLNGPLTIFR
jgi:gliding motility-associated-like protein